MTIDTTLLSVLYPLGGPQQSELIKNLEARPTPIKPVVTLSDVDSKSITRYFIRGSGNCSEVLEIDKTQYTALRTNPRYMVTSVNWKIVGKPYSTTTSYGAIDLGVEEYNKKQVQRADKTFGCLTEYIRDYLELWYANDDGTRTFVRVGGVLNPPFPNYMTSGSSIRNYVNIPMVTRTPTPTFTPTGTPAPSVTPSLSVTPSVTFTPTPSVTFTPTPSVTFTPSPTPTPSTTSTSTFEGNNGSWSGWEIIEPNITVTQLAVITE